MNIVKGPDNQPEERIRQMIQTYEKDLLRLCRVYVKDAATAEDAVQETFVKAYRSLNRVSRRELRKDVADSHCHQCMQGHTANRMVQKSGAHGESG